MAVPLRSKGALSDWINLKRVRPAEQPFPSRKGSNITVRRGSNEALPDFRTQATEAALSTTSPRSENFQNACPVIPSRCSAILAVSHRARENQGRQVQWTHAPSTRIGAAFTELNGTSRTLPQWQHSPGRCTGGLSKSHSAMHSANAAPCFSAGPPSAEWNVRR